MGSNENKLNAEVMVVASEAGHRLFRNNSGVAFHKDGSAVAYGVGPGGSDLIGWANVTVTPEMVGQTIAIFLSVEDKTDRPPKPGGKQDKWLRMVNDQGGVGVWGYDVETIMLKIRARIKQIQKGLVYGVDNL